MASQSALPFNLCVLKIKDQTQSNLGKVVCEEDKWMHTHAQTHRGFDELRKLDSNTAAHVECGHACTRVQAAHTRPGGER